MVMGVSGACPCLIAMYLLASHLQASLAFSSSADLRTPISNSRYLSRVAGPLLENIELTRFMIGATMNMFEVTTLGQPLEVLKTQMAANRSQTMGQAFKSVWSRGGFKGFYQGLIPWVSLIFYLPLSCWSCILCGTFPESSGEHRAIQGLAPRRQTRLPDINTADLL